jgi:hypothetical protein
MKEDTIVLSRREFTQLWTMFLSLFAVGVKAALPEPTDNKSFWQHRISPKLPDEWTYIEKALADQWEYENRPGAWNHENGLLSALLEGTVRHENPPELAEDYEPTARERRIVATVIQWLGTNCGRSFLHEASRRMGAPCYPFTEAMNKFRDAQMRREDPELWERLQKARGKHAWLPIK